jgi:hypothetical protein
MNNEDDLKVYFIRHKLDESRDLRERDLIAWDFGGGCYDNLDEYKKRNKFNSLTHLTSAHKAFKELENKGGLIVAEYSDQPYEFIVAEISKGTKRVGYPLKETRTGDDFVYTTLHFIKERPFKYSQYPLLAAIKPPYTTISQPRSSFEKVIRSIYSDRDLVPSIELLHPKMLEELCETFLRLDFVEDEIKIKYCLLKTGKTMPDVDIVYKSMSGQKCYAQVTFEAGKTAEDKTNRLLKFVQNEGKTIMFSRDEKCDKDGLDYHFYIDDVFNTFNQDPKYSVMIKDMIGLPDKKD